MRIREDNISEQQIQNASWTTRTREKGTEDGSGEHVGVLNMVASENVPRMLPRGTELMNRLEYMACYHLLLDAAMWCDKPLGSRQSDLGQSVRSRRRDEHYSVMLIDAIISWGEAPSGTLDEGEDVLLPESSPVCGLSGRPAYGGGSCAVRCEKSPVRLFFWLPGIQCHTKLEDLNRWVFTKTILRFSMRLKQPHYFVDRCRRQTACGSALLQLQQLAFAMPVWTF